MEIWKTIKEAPEYEVSDAGRVRRISSAAITSRLIFPYVLKPTVMATGYMNVILLSPGGKRISRLVHRLVLDAFVGARPPGMESAHFDGNKQNNRLENLRWATHSENSLDKRRHKTNRNTSKLSEANALEILAAKGEAVRALALRFGVTKRTINQIRAGETWAAYS